MSDHLDKFRSAMEAAGLTAPDEIHDDGKPVWACVCFAQRAWQQHRKSD
ncbi:hypothetical protein RCH09_003963 [Actimicrobium sp. GrIS 1.19]|nr:hypothetical protein [Actimicrobium sp. GrIS 1.19]